MLFVDAGNDVVSIAQATPVAKWFQIGGDPITTIKPSVSINAADDSGVNTSLLIRGGSPTIAFDQTSSGAGRILMDDSKVRFYTGTLDSIGTEVFTVGQGSGSETTANEGSIDMDFRVESNSNAHMLFVDAGNNKVGINKNSPVALLDVGGAETNESLMLRSGDNNSAANGGKQILFGYNNSASYAHNIRTRHDSANQTNNTIAFYTWQPTQAAGDYGNARIADFSSDGVVFNEDSRDADFRIESNGNSNMLFVDAGNDRIGINTSSPQEQIHSYAGGSNALRVSGGANANKKVEIGYDNTNGPYIKAGSSGETGLQFYVDNTSLTATLDNTGNFLVGKTSTGSSIRGSELRNGTSGFVATFKSDADGIVVDRNGNGANINFRRSGNSLGEIGFNNTARLYIVAGDTGIDFEPSTDAIRPVSGSGGARDNVIDLGRPDVRFDDFYATSGTVNTSDETEKQQIANLTDAEIAAAKAISKLFKTFKWNDAVAKKGDAARIHSGVVAQQVQNAMTAVGLDAADYGFWCSNTWWETHTEVAAIEANAETGVEAKDAYTHIESYYTAEEAPEGAVERTRLGIRYPELLAFIGAATEQRLTNIETRLATLEAN
jgi:hypothetical protein